MPKICYEFSFGRKFIHLKFVMNFHLLIDFYFLSMLLYTVLIVVVDKFSPTFLHLTEASSSQLSTLANSCLSCVCPVFSCRLPSLNSIVSTIEILRWFQLSSPLFCTLCLLSYLVSSAAPPALPYFLLPSYSS